MSDKPAIDQSKVAYRKPQPFGTLSDVFMPRALDLDADEHLWVPQAEGVWFKPLVLGCSQGFYVNLLRVRRAGLLSRHRHNGTVHAFILDVVSFLRELGLPSRLADLGMDDPTEAEIVELARLTMTAPHLANLAVPVDAGSVAAAIRRIKALSRGAAS